MAEVFEARCCTRGRLILLRRVPGRKPPTRSTAWGPKQSTKKIPHVKKIIHELDWM